MSDKIEQAAEERETYIGILEGMLKNYKHAVDDLTEAYTNQKSTITTLQAENERLKGALEKIAEGCSPKDALDDLTYSEIKELASEALTPKGEER